MVLCSVALASLVVLWGVNKKVREGVFRQVFLVLAGAAVLGILAGVSEGQEPMLLEGSRIARPENGAGSYEGQLEFSMNGETYEYFIEVPEQQLTREEQEEYLKAARKEIEQEFPGANTSLAEIREKVVIRDTYQEGRVAAEWSFDNRQAIDIDGYVQAENVPKEGLLVQAEVSLTCGEAKSMETFAFRVYPPVMSAQEEVIQAIGDIIDGQTGDVGEDFLELPQKVLGYSLNWQERRSYLPEQLLGLGAVVACLIPFMHRSREQELQKKRLRLLSLEYPDLVSKLALLLSAGMTVQGAWKRIALSYEKKRAEQAVTQLPAYEEMLIACRELESGMGEERVYERFGERCGQQWYRRLGSILAQNLRKGSYGIVRLLEEEAENAYEERKQLAKQYGEEASTKLLMPMMLMLGIVMVVLIVPAFISFQI